MNDTVTIKRSRARRKPRMKNSLVPKKVERDHNVVLVADDNTFIRFLVKKWLGDKADIVEVANGQEVLAAYQTYMPDLVFLDIHMPGKNGKDVLNQLMRVDPMAFVIMLSADSAKDNVVQSVKGGAKAFITKPFTRETLERYYKLCPSIRVIEEDDENPVPTDVIEVEPRGDTAETAADHPLK